MTDNLTSMQTVNMLHEIKVDEAEELGEWDMTREEQVDWLYRLRSALDNEFISTPWNKEFTKALTGILEQEPKIGKWILIDKELSRYKCSECGEVIKLHKKSEISNLEKDEVLSDYQFSHCGAKMTESEIKK